MKNTIHIVSLALLVFLSSCDFDSKKSYDSKTLVEKNNAKLELEIERKGYFSNNVSGSSEGEFMFQRMGSLQEVIKSFTPNNSLLVKGDFQDFTYNLKVTDFPAKDISLLRDEILSFMAEEVGFEWKAEDGTREFYSVEISNKELLAQARDYQAGIKQQSRITKNQISFVGTLTDLITLLNKEVDTPIEGQLPELGFNLKVELKRGRTEELFKELKNSYGITFNKEFESSDQIIITKL